MEMTRSIRAFAETVGEAAREDWLARRLCLPSLAAAIAIEETGWGRSPEVLLSNELYPRRRDRKKASYETFRDSVLSHNEYLATWKSPGQLRPNWECLTGEANYIRAVQYLQRAQFPYREAGYYEARLIGLIEGYGLLAFDSDPQDKFFVICTDRGLAGRKGNHVV